MLVPLRVQYMWGQPQYSAQHLQDGVAAAQRSMEGLQFPWPRAGRPLMFLNQLGTEELAPSGTSYLNRAGTL